MSDHFSTQALTHYYKTLHNDSNIPDQHVDYLHKIEQHFNIKPHVIYDIGAAVLHWTKSAKKVWKDSKIIAFEAVREVEDFYKEYGIDYEIGVFSDTDNKELTFYEHPIYLGGNSYYKESSKFSAAAEKIYDAAHESQRITKTIDSVVASRNFPLPDLIKIDVQGAELDVLNGMKNTIKSVKHIIIELQHVEYNIGARLVGDSIPFIESLGFQLVQPSRANPSILQNYFCGNGPDCDYHFMRV